MARRKPNQPTGEIKLELGELYPKQWQFIESKTRYTAYGGARGGGKTHVLIRACIRGALQYPGIKILILRRTYPELEQTIIQPMNKLVNSATMDGRPCGDLIATYNGTMRMLFFANGSTVKFGHLQSAAAITEYQGQEYDWIFMDEATHFTEYEFRTMGATLRGVNEIPKHFYLTCNPGGVGHQWVKRLFVTREYEGVESGRDYSFIPATVEDNKELLKASPEYIQMLDTLPEDIRAAHRYGDWDAMAGQYFSEFRRERHVVKPFIVPKEWPRYRAFDYGLDMFACYWFAIDFDDRVWVYREYCESGLIVSEAAADPAGGTDSVHRRPAGHVEHPEGHGAHHGRDFHGERHRDCPGLQPAGAGLDGGEGVPEGATGRTPGDALHRGLPSNDPGFARPPARRKEPLGLRQRAPRDYPQSRRPALWADLPDDGGTAGAGAAGAGRCGLCGGVRRLHDRRRGRRRISELRRIRT